MVNNSEKNNICEEEKQSTFTTDKYSGKYFSIMGDSISTLDGYNPKGYNVHYKNEVSASTGVHGIDDTWWGIVIKHFGAKLLVNSSWSGTRATHLSDRLPLFPSTSSKKRVDSLQKGNISPDVIIIYIGINDCGNGVKLAESGTHIPHAFEVFEFKSAYSRMLNLIHQKYPKAEVWCCTLNTFYIPGDDKFKFPYDGGKKDIKKFNAAIKSVVAENKCILLDIYSYGVPYETDDGLHPNSDGMKTMSNLIIKAACEHN